MPGERQSNPSRTSEKQRGRKTKRLQPMVIEKIVLKRCKVCTQARRPGSKKGKRRHATADSKSNEKTAHSKNRTSTSGKYGRPLGYSFKKGSCSKRLELRLLFHSVFFQKEDNADQERMATSSASATRLEGSRCRLDRASRRSGTTKKRGNCTKRAAK